MWRSEATVVWTYWMQSCWLAAPMNQALQTSCTGRGTFTLIYPLLCSVLTPLQGLEGCRCMHDFWKSWPANWHREIILFQEECIYLSKTAKKFHFKEMVWLQSLKQVWFVDNYTTTTRVPSDGEKMMLIRSICHIFTCEDSFVFIAHNIHPPLCILALLIVCSVWPHTTRF